MTPLMRKDGRPRVLRRPRHVAARGTDGEKVNRAVQSVETKGPRLTSGVPHDISTIAKSRCKARRGRESSGNAMACPGPGAREERGSRSARI